MKRTCYVAELSPAHAGQAVTLQGWVSRVRDFPGQYFVILRDRSGIAQLTVSRRQPGVRRWPGNCKRGRDRGHRAGTAARRGPAHRQSIRPASIEVIPSDLKRLSTAATPPFPVDGSPISVAEDLRLKYRYLDLRRPEM